MNTTNSVINNPELIVNETDILNEKYKILKIKDLKVRYGIGNDAAYALVRRKGFPSFVLPNNSFATREDLLLEWEENQMNANVNTQIDNMVDNKEERQKYIDRVEVLEKVKKLLEE